MSGEHEDSLHDFSKPGARKSTNCFHRNKFATGVRSSTNHFHRTVLERQKNNLCRLGSSEAIEINLRLTTSKRNAHFIFYVHFIFLGNFRAGPRDIIYVCSIVHCRIKQE